MRQSEVREIEKAQRDEDAGEEKERENAAKMMKMKRNDSNRRTIWINNTQ